MKRAISIATCSVILVMLAVFAVVDISSAQSRGRGNTNGRLPRGPINYSMIMLERTDLATPETKMMPVPDFIAGALWPGMNIQAFDMDCRIKPRCKFTIIDGDVAVINTHECDRRSWEISECYQTECDGETYSAAIIYRVAPSYDSDMRAVNEFWNGL